jgi:1-deoxy-D-xylulose-5-phosphate synthase
MLYTGFTLDAPVAVRYPRGSGPGVAVAQEMTAIPVGQAEVRRQSKRRRERVAILAFGSVLQPALVAGETLDATVVNMRFVKPLDTAAVLNVAGTHDVIVTVEENVVMGGAGSAVAEALAHAGVAIPIVHLGLPDVFPDHGDPAAILREYGLDAAGIVASIRERVGSRKRDRMPQSA